MFISFLIRFAIPAFSGSTTLLEAPLHHQAKEKKVTISQIEIPKGKGLPLHTHQGDEYAVLIEGKVKQTLAGNETIIKPGQAVHIPYGVKHKITALTAVKAIVFRVNDVGSPEMTVVE